MQYNNILITPWIIFPLGTKIYYPNVFLWSKYHRAYICIKSNMKYRVFIKSLTPSLLFGQNQIDKYILWGIIR